MKSITPESLSKTFGYKSDITGKSVSELCKLIENNLQIIDINYKNWEILFNEAGGYKSGKIGIDIDELKNYYSIKTGISSIHILFAFHTYFSILVRWLTYRIIKPTDNHEPHSSDFNPKIIKNYFEEIGIDNFGETEYFDWYYDFRSPDLLVCFDELSRIIECFDTELMDQDKRTKNDFLKLLYQNLFPPKIRHHLGEYYTPDWVAELAIKNSGYDFNPDKRILDPSCGSGTFILQVLESIINKNADNPKKEIIEKIINNVWGFDLNPLAVLSAKSNYIISIKDFLPLLGSHTIPVYQFDSIAFENPYLKNTTIDLFNTGEIIPENTTILPDNIKNNQFDYIFGNPPWINWKFLPDYYREAVLPAAEKYDLFEHKGYKARLGFAQDDVSVIMTYVVIDHFLKDSGMLSFVLPQTLLKTFGGGTGFRQFKLGKEGKYLKVHSVIDLSNFKVFDTSSSKSAIITIEKNKKTLYPVQYDIWYKKNGSGITQSQSLEEISHNVTEINNFAIPIKEKNSSWFTANKEILNLLPKLIRPSEYKARAGVCTWSSSIYWLNIIKEGSKYWTVKNFTETAKIKQKETVFEIEPDLLYPLVRGKNIKRWSFISELYILLPQSPDNFAKAIDEKVLKEIYPKTYSYLSKFNKFLLNRKGYKKFLNNTPFYSVYDIGNYTIDPYKVAWKYIDTDLRSVVLEGERHDKPFIPDLNVITISVQDKKEAHYISAMLNSSLIRLIIHTFGLCTRITPGILNYLPVDKYDPGNSLHCDLSNLSLNCHSGSNNLSKLDKNIHQIDDIIKKLFKLNINDDKIIRENLAFYLNKTGTGLK